jgi:hypothetical protein
MIITVIFCNRVLYLIIRYVRELREDIALNIDGIYVRGIDFASNSTIFQLVYGIVPTVWHIFLCISFYSITGMSGINFEEIMSVGTVLICTNCNKFF